MLTEDQIERYSRQILLREVGGLGQERLLSTGAELLGQGRALWFAAAYLAAGGTPLTTSEGPPEASEAGFLGSPVEAEPPAWNVIQASLAAMNPDALASVPVRGCIAAAPKRPRGDGPWVLLGEGEGTAAIAYRAVGGCGACFEAVAKLVGASDVNAGLWVGAWAAYTFQLLVLGQMTNVGRLVFELDGRMDHEPRTCDHPSEVSR